MQLEIKEPCTADWNGMKPCSGGRHCELCKLTVIDGDQFSNTDLFEMLKEKGKICLNIRSTRLKTNSLRIKLVSSVENFFLFFNLKKIALVSGSILLFASCCRERFMGGINSCNLDDVKVNTQKEFPVKAKKFPPAAGHF